MQAYGEHFARIYNERWAGFADFVAPYLIDFYAATAIAEENKNVLDLCCGAGHLARHLLEAGYRVTGVDLSEHMLQHARQNTGDYMAPGQASFVQADATDFALDERFGLVVSTYDSLNHLEDEAALLSCFKCVYAVCDGYFVFDLNTRQGLSNWNMTHVDDSREDAVIIRRGSFDADSDRATLTITGFVVMPDGSYRRFDEEVFNTVFELDRVKSALLEVGWKNVYFAHIRDLSTPLDDPEDNGRVFVVAQL